MCKLAGVNFSSTCSIYYKIGDESNGDESNTNGYIHIYNIFKAKHWLDMNWLEVVRSLLVASESLSLAHYLKLQKLKICCLAITDLSERMKWNFIISGQNC